MTIPPPFTHLFAKILCFLFYITFPILEATAVESFEKAPLGTFSHIKTAYGDLNSTKEHVEIIRGGKTGEKSLRIMGGDKKAFVLTLDQPPSQETKLHAWAERWTRNGPFEFTITASSPAGEKKIYDGRETIKTGGFHAQIEATIPKGAQKLTFTCTSPDGSGIKLDDLHIIPVIPMKIESVNSVTGTWPVMIRMDYNPVFNLKIETEGCLTPQTLNEVYLDFKGTTNPADIDSITLHKGGSKLEEIPEESLFTSHGLSGNGKVVLKGSAVLDPGENNFRISIRLKDTADMDGSITAKLEKVLINKKNIPISGPVTSNQRIGYAVVKQNDFQSKFYRIPGITRSLKGTLIAVFDIRYDHSGDLPARIDVGVRRSVDGGKSWTPIAIAIKDTEIAPELGATNGVGDPAILVDEKSGRIWLAAIWSHKHSIWGSKSGDNSPEACGQLVLAYSDDDGMTWSKPINITEQTKDLSWRILFNGPGMGICMKDGTLVFPAQYWDKDGVPFSTIVYSTDHGKTWQCGSGVHEQTTEAQVAELGDGTLMINARCNWGGSRVVATTSDLGTTWSVHPTNRKDLREPVCQASLIAVEIKSKYGRALLFSNPDSTDSRSMMTLKASRDDGLVWPQDSSLLYDSRSGWGYSCLTPIDDKYVGVFYEGRGPIYFLRIPYVDIFNTNDCFKNKRTDRNGD